jgi:thiol-disulfide isomerase/thioredoxin
MGLLRDAVSRVQRPTRDRRRTTSTIRKLAPRVHRFSLHMAHPCSHLQSVRPLQLYLVILGCLFIILQLFHTHASLCVSYSDHQTNSTPYSVRNTDTLQTYLSTASSSRIPLLTLWTASYCPSCRTVAPLIRSLVEEEGGVGLAEIEFDAPDIMAGEPNPAMTYMITSLPTLLSFDAGEAQTATKLTDVRSLSDRQFLVEWIRNEARRHGGRGGGGGGGGSLFGGLFGR